MKPIGCVAILLGVMLLIASGCTQTEPDQSETSATQTESKEASSTQPPTDVSEKAEQDGTVTGAMGRALLKGLTGQKAQETNQAGEAPSFQQ